MDLVTPLLPAQEVSVLAGAPGAGKTRLLMQLVAALHQGDAPWGLAAQTGVRTAFIAADRSWNSHAQWARAAGVDLDRLPHKALIDDDLNLSALKTDPFTIFVTVAKSLLPCDLLIVDPLILFLGGDLRNYTNCAAALIKINRFAKAHAVTILGTHHAAKSRTDYGYKRPQDRISGSSALLGYTSTQIFLDTPEESGKEFHELHILPHHAPPLSLEFEVGKNGLFMLKTDDASPRQQLLEAIPFDETVSTSELVDTFVSPDLSRATVFRYLNDLKQSGQVHCPQHGAYQRRRVS